MSFTTIDVDEEELYIISTFIITPLSLVATIAIYVSLHRTMSAYKNGDENPNHMSCKNEYYAINIGLSS